MDGDGDLDAVTTFFSRVFLLENDRGRLTLRDTGQYTGGTLAEPLLGDFDGDGDLDLFMQTSIGEGNAILLNEDGAFVDSGQVIGDGEATGVALGDLNGDGDLDLAIAKEGEGIEIWLSHQGGFIRTGQLLGSAGSFGIALGDPDGDGSLDAFLANHGDGNTVWENGLIQPDPEVTLTVDETSIAEAGGEASLTVSLSAASLLPVTVDLAVSGTAVLGEDFAISRTSLFIDPGATSAAGAATLVSLAAIVPEGAEIGRQHVLEIHSVRVVDDDGSELPAIADDAVHLAGYLADVSGNARINASDAATCGTDCSLARQRI